MDTVKTFRQLVESGMVDEDLRRELVAMRQEDLRVRQEFLEAGELGGPYVPRMEAVHLENAARLRVLIAQHGWPAENIAGKDGAEAAWFIAQHAIGEPGSGRRRAVSVSGWFPSISRRART